MKILSVLAVVSALILFAACSQNPLSEGKQNSTRSDNIQLNINPDPEPDPDPGDTDPVEKPDLIFTAVNVDDYTSTRIYYSYTLKNIGSASISLSQVKVQAYISLNATLDSSDPSIGFSTASLSVILAPGQSFSGSFSTTPSPGLIQPERYLFLKAVTTVSEILKSNNTRYNQIFLRWVDLVYTQASAVFQNNGYMSTYAVLKNNGFQSLRLDGVNQAMYLSSDSTYSSGDLTCGSINVAAWANQTQMNPGEELVLQFSASPQAGFNPSIHRYLLIVADKNQSIFEVNEQNNIAVVQFTIQP